MTIYTADYFRNTADLSPLAAHQLLLPMAEGARLDIAHAVLDWLDTLPDQALGDLGDAFWGPLPQGSSPISPAQRSIRLCGVDDQETQTAPGILLAAVVWPRDDEAMDVISTAPVPLHQRQRAYFERSAQVLYRVQRRLLQDGNLECRPFDDMMVSHLGRLRDREALAWLLLQTESELRPSRPIQPRHPLTWFSFVSPPQSMGLLDVAVCQANPVAIHALLSHSPSLPGACARSVLEMQRASSSRTASVATAWARALCQEALDGRIGRPQSLFATLSDMVGEGKDPTGLHAGLRIAEAVLSQRSRDRKGALTLLEAFWPLLPDDIVGVAQDRDSQWLLGNQLANLAQQAAHACHAPSLRWLLQAVPDWAAGEADLPPRPGLSFGVVQRAVGGALLPDMAVPVSDLCETLQVFKDRGIDLVSLHTKDGNLLHLMARAGGMDLLPKMLALVEAGVDPLAPTAAGRSVESFLQAGARPQWRTMVESCQAAAAARAAIRELQHESLGNVPPL